MALILGTSLALAPLPLGYPDTRAEPPSSALPIHEKKHKAIKRYLRLHSKLSRQFCKGADRTYEELVRNYRGNGFYVPSLRDHSLDAITIRNHLPLLEKKLAWINFQINQLATRKTFPEYKSLTTALQGDLDQLLELKKLYRLSPNLEDRKLVRYQSIAALKQLKTHFQEMVGQIPFLVSFGFPVDHFEHRKAYEDMKNRRFFFNKRKLNDIFFQRKIYEDGAMDPNQTRADVFLRSTLDTIAIRLPTERLFLSEASRFDIDWALDRLKKQLKRGKKKQIARLKEWASRTSRSIRFYKNLLNGREDGIPRSIATVSDKSKSYFELSDFVYRKQARVYEFMASQDELMKALYVMDTILFNEVGGGEDELNREDIVQIVINRKENNYYSSLPKTDDLYPYLEGLTAENIQTQRWLNVLFKRGEFSFTYPFIPSVQGVFCPSLTRYSQKVRKRNLEIAFDVLSEPHSDFKALRYFSRVSMLGKIDMGGVWTDYERVNERPGKPIRKNLALLKKRIKEGKFKYYYSFKSKEDTRFDVIEINNELYAIEKLETNPQFFEYRNPHYFAYFNLR